MILIIDSDVYTIALMVVKHGENWYILYISF